MYTAKALRHRAPVGRAARRAQPTPRSASMRAALRVHAPVVHAQALHRPPRHQVLGHDCLGIFRLNAAIPDGFRIDYNRRPVFALIQAAGFVDSHPPCKSRFLGQLLQPCVQVAFPFNGAGRPRRAAGPKVVADKNMALKWGQTNSSSGRMVPRVRSFPE